MKKNRLLIMVLFLSAGLLAFQQNLSAERLVYTNGLDMRFVLINAGTFYMGSPESETGHQWNEKRHKVTITKDFFMQETEVTQGQWQKLVGFNPSSFETVSDRYPVDTVSWHQCREFIRVLNEWEGTDKYRLPTEAEWEYACRAGSSTAFANGKMTRNVCDVPDPVLDKMAWYCYNSGLQTPPRNFHPHPVKTKIPNRWGLYDMHGNVQEWVLDACKQRDIWTGKIGPVTDTYRDGVIDPVSEKGDHRIIRGGGWYQKPVYLRSAQRNFYKPMAKRNSLGFRIVRER